MSRVYFISDLHLGHEKILQFSPNRQGATVAEHDEWLIDSINSVVNRRDLLFLLGDVAFSREGLCKLSSIRANKHLILGNHDQFKIEDYISVGFKIRPGILKYKGFWLSHAPIHPDELRGCINIHGHVHHKTITKSGVKSLIDNKIVFGDVPDDDYINVCVEELNGIPLSLDDIKYRVSLL